MSAHAEDHQEIFKIVLAGDSGVGKTHILNRYIKGQIPKNNIVPTIGVEFATKIVPLKTGEKIKAQIWDTAGQERYRHYRKARGALLVFDLTKERTFDNVSRWIEDIKNMAEPEIIIMLVGNKLDLISQEPSLRKVAKEEGKKLAKENDLFYVETSAFEGTNITSAFEDLLNEIAQRKKSEEHKHHENSQHSHAQEKEEDEDRTVKVGKSNGTSQEGFCKGC